MLIIPDHRTILILPPRTGSSSLHRAIMETCPGAFMLYRHAERDAIPPGYEDYTVMGFVRHPLARMWSLYKFLCQLDPVGSETWAQEEVMRLLESVQGATFEDWLLTNTELFLPEGTGHPGLFQTHYLPENIKSQELYLRPDLGTTIMPFSDLRGWMSAWGLPPLHVNKTTTRLTVTDTPEIREHLEQHFKWELGLGLDLI